jgi:hypothetical protein
MSAHVLCPQVGAVNWTDGSCRLQEANKSASTRECERGIGLANVFEWTGQNLQALDSSWRRFVRGTHTVLKSAERALVAVRSRAVRAHSRLVQQISSAYVHYMTDDLTEL